jgi:hypothetical protein
LAHSFAIDFLPSREAKTAELMISLGIVEHFYSFVAQIWVGGIRYESSEYAKTAFVGYATGTLIGS